MASRSAELLGQVRIGGCAVVPLMDGRLADLASAILGRPKRDDSAVPNQLAVDDVVIRLPVYGYLVRSGREVILIDTGYGDEPDPVDDVVRPPGPLREVLEVLGISRFDVTIVVNTHLHSDHSGGDTFDDHGKRRPAFPNAPVCVQRAEWLYSRHPTAEHRSLYKERLLQPLVDYEVLRLLDGETGLTAEVRCVPAPGHTPGHQIVVIESGGAQAVFLGDAAMIRGQFLTPFWTSPYDMDAATAASTKESIQRRLGNRLAWVAFGHDEPLLWGENIAHGESSGLWP